MGSINLSALYKEVTPERHRELVILIGESLMREVFPACSQRAGRLIDTGDVIIDLEGFRYDGAFCETR